MYRDEDYALSRTFLSAGTIGGSDTSLAASPRTLVAALDEIRQVRERIAQAAAFSREISEHLNGCVPEQGGPVEDKSRPVDGYLDGLYAEIDDLRLWADRLHQKLGTISAAVGSK